MYLQSNLKKKSDEEPISDEPAPTSTLENSEPRDGDDSGTEEGKEAEVEAVHDDEPSSPMTDRERGDQTKDTPDADRVEDGSDDGSSTEPEPDSESFLSYAVEYWVDHAIQAPADVVDEFDFSDEFWSESSSIRSSWWDERSRDTRYEGLTGITPMHLAALTEYSALLDRLLEDERTDELQKADSWGYTPLVWACDGGDISLIGRLFKARADVNKVGDNEGPSALWAAAFRGHLEAVQYLLEQGAEPNLENKERGTALYVAASGSCLDIVGELLKHGATVNLKGGSHVRPLNAAAYFGYMDILQLLLEHGAEIDPDDDYRYGSALGAAARRGHDEVIRKLLRKGWSVNRKMKTYNSPLVAAAAYGHAEAVLALLEHEVEGVSQVQALEVASQNGRTEVVKHLLERAPNLPHQKAFHNAAMYGRDDILDLLEKRGTSPELLDKALYDAADQERESTVNLLLKFGANGDAEGKE